MNEWVSEEKQVLFSETDASTRVHFTSILRYVENAEHVLLNSLEINVFGGEEALGWPRGHVECRYLKPLYYHDPYQVKLVLKRLGTSSLTWGFKVISNESEIALGEIRTVLVGEGKGPLPLPEKWRSQLEGFQEKP